MMLFLVGVLEMLLVTLWTKWVVDAKIIASGVVTMMQVFIWYFVLQTIIEDLDNFSLVMLYALGCAVGTMISMYLSSLRTKKEPQIQATVSPKQDYRQNDLPPGLPVAQN